MQEVYKFLLDNWQLILSVVLFLVSVIVSIVRKKPLQDIYSQLYAWCIAAVNVAEKTALKGDSKKQYALDVVKSFLKDKFPNIKEDYYIHAISVIIEQILATPQKKGE